MLGRVVHETHGRQSRSYNLGRLSEHGKMKRRISFLQPRCKAWECLNFSMMHLFLVTTSMADNNASTFSCWWCFTAMQRRHFFLHRHYFDLVQQCVSYKCFAINERYSWLPIADRHQIDHCDLLLKYEYHRSDVHLVNKDTSQEKTATQWNWFRFAINVAA